MSEEYGLIASVYRDAHGQDTTGGGLSSMGANVYVFGDGIQNGTIVRADLDGEDPILEIRDNKAGAAYGKVAYPVVDRAEGSVGPMFGGNFVWTSDSRFRVEYGGPVPIHDRFETKEQYASHD